MDQSNQKLPPTVSCLFFITLFLLMVACLVGVISGDYDKGAMAAQKIVISGISFIVTIITFFAFLAFIGRR